MVSPDAVDLGGLSDADDPEQAARVNAWRERLAAKSQRARSYTFREEPEPMSTSYWSEEVLFAESRDAEEAMLDDATDRATIDGLLLDWGLPPEATAADVNLAFRRLAKVHHPDRWVLADETTQLDHEAAMRRVNRIYAVLTKALGSS